MVFRLMCSSKATCLLVDWCNSELAITEDGLVRFRTGKNKDNKLGISIFATLRNNSIDSYSGSSVRMELPVDCQYCKHLAHLICIVLSKYNHYLIKTLLALAMIEFTKFSLPLPQKSPNSTEVTLSVFQAFHCISLFILSTHDSFLHMCVFCVF